MRKLLTLTLLLAAAGCTNYQPATYQQCAAQWDAHEATEWGRWHEWAQAENDLLRLTPENKEWARLNEVMTSTRQSYLACVDTGQAEGSCGGRAMLAATLKATSATIQPDWAARRDHPGYHEDHTCSFNTRTGRYRVMEAK